MSAGESSERAGGVATLSRRSFISGAAGIAMSASVFGAGAAPMLRRSIPRAPNESVPVIGMGTWNTFDVGAGAEERAALVQVLEAFYAAGARLIDSSPMYGAAERVTGDLVAQLRQQANTFFATKVWTSGRDKGAAQIEESMRLLRTPRIDLMQIHNLLDWRAHLPTLHALQAQQRVRYIGVTHYTVGAYSELEKVLRAERFDFAQFNYSIATRAAEERLLPLCQELGVAVLINRPFEEGALFAKVRNRKLPHYAAEIGCATWSQFFLKFIVSHPAVTCVIPATSRVAHVRDNLQAGFGALPDAALRRRMAQDFEKG